PQFATSVCVFTSQPVAYFMSQSANPMLQESTAQAPCVHAGMPFCTVHAVPHLPQFMASVARFFSQPFIALLSQSPKGILHMPIPHTPALQPAVALGGGMQTFPHRPQLPRLSRSTSQPSLGSLLQSKNPNLHGRIPPAPSRQPAAPWRAPGPCWPTPAKSNMSPPVSPSPPVSGFLSQSE